MMINFHRSFSLTQIPQSVSFRHKQDTYHTFDFEIYIFLFLLLILTLATLLISPLFYTSYKCLNFLQLNHLLISLCSNLFDCMAAEVMTR